jgi:hypothetical protein
MRWNPATPMEDRKKVRKRINARRQKKHITESMKCPICIKIPLLNIRPVSRTSSNKIMKMGNPLLLNLTTFCIFLGLLCIKILDNINIIKIKREEMTRITTT